MNHGTFTAYNKGCRCEACKARKQASWKNYYAENRDAWLEKGKAERERDPEYLRRWRAANAEKARGYQREWAKKNKSKIAAMSKRYAAANAERLREKQLAWKKTERGRVYNAGLQHARRQAPLTPEGRDFAVILRRDPCSYCGGPAGTIDHINAIHSGGDGDWINLTSACRSCNARKRTRPLLTFLRELAA